MRKFRLALTVSALAATFIAYAIPVTVTETNTIDQIEFLTYWTYDIDLSSTPATATLLKLEDASGDVTIRNLIAVNGKLCTVNKIGEGAIANNPSLLSCTIPNTILEIGAYAFSNCTALAEITLDYGIRYIGERAFVNTIVREIKVPDSLLDMGGNILAGTLFTSTINIEDSSHFKYSDDGVLYNRDMTKLYACPTRAEGTITIPETLTNICTDAFFGCHRITYLNIPATVNTIGSGAFNVAGIWPGLKAPESTPKLKTIFFNGTPPEAPDDIFNGAPEDLVIYALSNEWDGMSTWKGKKVKPIDGANPPILSYTDATGITWFYRIVNSEVEICNEDASGNPTTAVSPASTSGIAYKESEESTTSRKALKIPDAINGFAVTKIGAHAFDGCKALIYVGIPSSVHEIGDGAFSGCASISAIGDSQAIPFGTADNTIDLPSSVTKLGYRPFEGTQVTSVSLPYSLSELDGNPVAGCAFVSSLSVDPDCPSFYSEGNILYNKRKNTAIAVPANYDGASVSFLDSVTTIGEEALFECKNIASVQIPVATESIDARAFEGCSSIKSLTLPASIARIDESAFGDCESLAKVTYLGDAPDAADDIYSGTPESLVSYVSADAKGFTDGTWKNRKISKDDPDPEDLPEPGQVTDSSGITWTYDVVGTKAVVTDISGESETVTIPATIAGLDIDELDLSLLDGLSGVKAYKSESDLYKAKNGCLYSADGETLLRVPDSLVLPYSATTEISSRKVTVTIIPGLKDSGNQGNDGTSVTTNTTSSSTSRTTKKIDGDISFETLLSGVTTIADHAFYGCNSNFTNEYTSTSENLAGETGFIGAGGDAYVRTSKLETTTKTTYDTTLTLPATVKNVSANAFEESGVVPSKTGGSKKPASGAVSANVRLPSSDASQLEECSRYIGWIEQSGKIVGTVAVKTGKARNGVIKTSGSVVKIGAKKTKIKSMSELSAIDGLTLVKDLSASKSDAATFNAFKGKCWTVALMTSNSNAALLDGYTTLSIAVQAKGKVRIAGTAADGTKISASAQMVVDGDTFKIPVAAQLYSGKRGGFATVFTVTEEGEISVDGTSVAFTAILNGAPVHASLTPIASAPRGNALSGDISIWDAGNDEYSLAENLGWKPRYTKSSGQFKGKLYLIRNSDMKRVRAIVTGVVANEIGYGTAVVKGVRSLKVEVK